MTFPYVVYRGDTLCRLARRYGLSLAAVYEANPELKAYEELKPGQILQLPLRSAGRYTIQAGEGIADIARRLQLSESELRAANPGLDSRRLRIGQTIALPTATEGTIVDPLAPYGYPELSEDIGLLREKYPFFEVSEIGTSVEGRTIHAIRLGEGTRELHYNASFHANEWITSLLLMKFVEDCARALVTGESARGHDIRRLLADCALWIVPMVNPDGVELVRHGAPPPGHPQREALLALNGGSPDFSGWKANIRGVDLNDQFPAAWETEKERRAVPGPGPRDYTGETPLSEPEARALADFTRRRDFALVMALHTQGEEIYWNYRDYEPPQAAAAADRLAKVSGYTAVKLTESDAGYKDWFIQEFGRLGFTVEAGSGVNPLPLSQFHTIYARLQPLLLEGLQLAAE